MKKALFIVLLTVIAASGAYIHKQKTMPFEKNDVMTQKRIQYMTDRADLSNKKDTIKNLTRIIFNIRR